MAIQVRISYKDGAGYTDMALRSSMQAIIDADDVYKKVFLTVDIPASQDLTQTISITTDNKMAESAVDMFLNTTGEQAQSDYNTISQFQVLDNQLVITRLGDKPTGSINVTLIFYEKGAQ